MQRRHSYHRAFVRAALVVLLATGCGGGDDDGNPADDGGTGAADADPLAPDAIPTGAPECSNGIDDDGDGLIDGFDPECISAADDREDSFATGIPGDNIDAIKQDCFFDGNSGHGDDGCLMHVCCLLDECPPDLSSGYDPEDCEVVQDCIDFCAPLTPPGCDCFGCCTVCGDDGCFDVLTNPATSPNCDTDVLDDPEQCPRCTKIDECGPGDCTTLECVLCPGQTPDDLPVECGGVNECPDDLTPCTATADCGAEQFCANGCCIAQVD